MTSVTHLARHDLRSQRMPLWLFAALLAIEAAIIVIGVRPARRLDLVPVLPLIRLLFTSVVAALIVQMDSLVGTTAFWRSRPIGRTTLMAGKLTSIGLSLVVVPGVVASAAWWYTGLLFQDACVVGGTVAVEQATVVLLTAMAAIVTPSLTHLIVAGVAGTTLVTLINAVVLPAILATWPFVGQSLGGAHPAIYLGALFVLGVPAIAHQYLTLREWRTAAMVGFALLVAAGATRLWPVHSYAWPLAPINRAVIDPSAITLSVRPSTMQRSEQTFRIAGVPVPLVHYEAVVEAAGHPADVFFTLLGLESRLLLRDRTFLKGTAWWGPLVRAGIDGFQDPRRESMQLALGRAQLPPPPPWRREERLRGTVIAGLALDDERGYQGQRGIVTATARVDARRYVVVAAVPARPGARIRDRGLSLEIVAVNPGGLVSVRVSRVEGFSMQDYLRWGAFVIRNTTRREAYVLDAFDTYRGWPGTGGIMRLNAYRTTGEFRPRQTYGESAPPSSLDQAWMADAELVFLNAEALGTLTCTFQTELVVGSGGTPSPDPRAPSR